MVRSLEKILPGEKCVIKEMQTEPGYTARLRDFGMVPGTTLVCRYCDPGNHLLALECRGAVIALRRADVQNILVGP